MTIGKRLKELRDQKGMSRSDLAKEIDISYPALSKYETDERAPDYDMLLKFADYFEVSTDFLLGNSQMYNQSFENIGKFLICEDASGKYPSVDEAMRAIAIKMDDLLSRKVISEDKAAEYLKGIRAQLDILLKND